MFLLLSLQFCLSACLSFVSPAVYDFDVVDEIWIPF